MKKSTCSANFLILNFSKKNKKIMLGNSSFKLTSLAMFDTFLVILMLFVSLLNLNVYISSINFKAHSRSI